ncbi:MAG: hypothetical protein WC130_04320 [Kiritimatiellia bacterium]
MTVCGQYKKSFGEATHCCFNGNLNDPCFRGVAIQKITERTDECVTLDKSGRLAIKRKDGKDYVALTYPGILGKQRTTGHPFKDDGTELPNTGRQPRLAQKET